MRVDKQYYIARVLTKNGNYTFKLVADIDEWIKRHRHGIRFANANKNNENATERRKKYLSMKAKDKLVYAKLDMESLAFLEVKV